MSQFSKRALVLCLVAFARCGDSGPSNEVGQSGMDGGAGQVEKDASDVSPDAVLAPPAGPANVILVLADDLAWNLVQYMPNVQAMQKEGVTFSNYFVTDSLCCPSRTSILTGKFPHNSGVFANQGSDGGYATYLAKGNDADTFAVQLSAAGYKTAIGGKLLNGYRVDGPMGGGVKGFTDWYLADNGYPEFDYDLTENGTIHHYANKATDYLTDVMLKHGASFIKAQTNAPFFLEVATFAPHAPFRPAPRHEALFPDLGAPRTPRFNTKPKNNPPWLDAIPTLTASDIAAIDDKFRHRAQMVQALDELIGELRKTVAAMPPAVANNTYIAFSSDNGFHLGDYSLAGGKMTAFDTDINVPLIVVGPGLPANRVVDNIVENVDLCPTFAELGKVSPPAKADGHSLVALLQGAVADWRDAALIEHHRSGPDANDPDLPPAGSGDPPDYSAMRTKDFLFVEYIGGAAEYYSLKNDPNELNNQIGTLSVTERKRLHDWLASMKACKGATECWAAQHAPAP